EIHDRPPRHRGVKPVRVSDRPCGHRAARHADSRGVDVAFCDRGIGRGHPVREGVVGKGGADQVAELLAVARRSPAVGAQHDPPAHTPCERTRTPSPHLVKGGPSLPTSSGYSGGGSTAGDLVIRACTGRPADVSSKRSTPPTAMPASHFAFGEAGTETEPGTS